jgi:hypothetical protein
VPMKPSDVVALTNDVLLPTWRTDREKLDRIDAWYRWQHEDPHSPTQARHTREYRELKGRAQTPWLGLVVTTIAQTLYVEGYRRSGESDSAPPWRYWQENQLDARQIAIHRSALAYGLSYSLVLPGRSFTGAPVPVIRGLSPRDMIAVYQDPAADDWAMYALRAKVTNVEDDRLGRQKGLALRVYDDEAIYRLQVTGDGSGSKVVFIDYEEHNVGVCPVVRFANALDLEGRSNGEVEPFISIASRIDQTTFDRLVVQRFASWVVRTIAGMSAPEQFDGESQSEYEERTKQRLKVEDILVADDPDTKFGSLPATPLDGFIESKDSDVRDLAAVAQVPPQHLLGQMANLSADALRSAEIGRIRKTEERRHLFGESWEQTLRLGAYAMRDMEAANDVEAQVVWRDVDAQSLGMVADALGKISDQLGVPGEALWERIPGVTQTDVERWKQIASQGGAIEALMSQLVAGQSSPAGFGGGNP